MKTLLDHLCQLALILCLLLSDVNESNSQGNEWDSIENEKVTVAGIRLGDSLKEMIARIGKPASIVTKVNEFEGTEYFQYLYGKSQFSVTDNRVSGFHLNDSSYSFGCFQIRVGDPIKVLRQSFPHSFNSQFERNDKTVIKVQIGNSDSYILFLCQKEMIREIMTWDDL